MNHDFEEKTQSRAEEGFKNSAAHTAWQDVVLVSIREKSGEVRGQRDSCMRMKGGEALEKNRRKEQGEAEEEEREMW